MKKITIYSLVLTLGFALAGCFKDVDISLADNPAWVEFEDAVRRTPAAGVIYPIINVTRTAGTQSLVVNLSGAQLKATEEMSVSVDTAIAPLLNATTIRAVEGTHFSLVNSGRFTFRTDTSFSVVRFNVLNPGATTGRTALVVLRLNGNDRIRAAENYRRVGFRINLN